MLQLVQCFLVAFNVHQHVMCLVDLLNRVSQLTAAPIFQAVNDAFLGSDQCALALDHRGNLLALIGMHDKYDFVVSHYISLWIKAPRLRLRWSKVSETGHQSHRGANYSEKSLPVKGFNRQASLTNQNPS